MDLKRATGRRPGLLTRAAWLSGTLATITMATAPGAAEEHVLRLSPQSVQFGRFDAAIPPVLTVTSGYIVTVQTAARVEPRDVDASGAVPASAVPTQVREIFSAITDRGPGGHVLTGPIAIEGAEPGDVLEVRVLKVGLAVDYGYNPAPR